MKLEGFLSIRGFCQCQYNHKGTIVYPIGQYYNITLKCSKYTYKICQ